MNEETTPNERNVAGGFDSMTGMIFVRFPRPRQSKKRKAQNRRGRNANEIQRRKSDAPISSRAAPN
jgi:hypothetical protein